ncbi:MAG: hypothetical protein GWO20_03650, partial [Candidatus Korarchaeota archaeon]|nr:hypothetical protein [Candidatus Korarchaeota archaeon]NIU83606.1 hypothetical protein [Candidatus Thorarchaeota archaeon]NIW14114.1 hypothetical protein [Candidatus Thorarchaeota archaeon]NIW52221.1 hypothetical protein [Candidatus Korarchaeota archaeon]
MESDMEKYKEEIIREKHLEKEELEEMIEKKSQLPGISGKKMAIIAVAQELGVENKELMERMMDELILPDSLKKIGDLRQGMRCTSLVARLARILPRRQGKMKEYQNLLLLDDTGEILLTFFGKDLSKLENQDLRRGDVFLIKCVNVRDLSGRLSLTAVEETKVRKLEEEGHLTAHLPALQPPLSVSDLLDAFQSMEVNETEEVNCKGVLVWKGDVREFERNDGSIGRVMNFRIAERGSEESIRGVAWGKGGTLVTNLDLGDIVHIRGGKVKVSSYQLERGQEKRDALEIHIGNLTNIERKGRNAKKLEQAEEGMRGELFYLYALEPPQVREYEREGEQRQMLFLKVGDETGVARLVVWTQSLIDTLRDLERKDRLKAFGNVREGQFYEVEIHVSNTGMVKKNPPHFPEVLTWAEVEKSEKREEETPTRHIGLVSEFSKLTWDVQCDLEGTLEYKDINPPRRKGTIILGDGKNRVEGRIRSRRMLKDLKEVPNGSVIRLKNVTTPKRGGKYDLENVFIKESSSLEIIEAPAQDVKRLEEAEKREKRRSTPLLLQEIQDEGVMEVLVAVNGIKEVEMKEYCTTCGGMAISSEGKHKICERGHKTQGRELLSLILDVGDGQENGSAIINGNTVMELGLSDKTKSEILSNKNEFKKEVSRKIVGEDLLLEGEVRFEGGESR